MEKYKNKYRTQSIRLQNWDYSWDGAYFITICTKDGKCYLGDIVNGQIKLSPIGIMANILWYEIKNHASHFDLGEFVVMPNHIHGILILDKKNNDNNDNGGDGNNGNNGVETRHALSLQQRQQQRRQRSTPSPKIIGENRFQNQGKNTVSSIVGGYKSAVSKHAHRLGFDFEWQRNYWEHIIRNENEYQRIAQYILDNPKKWAWDKLNGGVGNQVMELQATYNEEEWMV